MRHRRECRSPLGLREGGKGGRRSTPADMRSVVICICCAGRSNPLCMRVEISGKRNHIVEYCSRDFLQANHIDAVVEHASQVKKNTRQTRFFWLPAKTARGVGMEL